MEHFLLHLAKTSAIVGAVIALTLILRPALQKRFASKARYWLWLVLAVALVPSPVYTVANAPVQITPPSEHVMVWPDKQAVAPKIVHKDVFAPEEITPALSSAAPDTDGGVAPQPVRRIVEVSTVLFWAWLAGVAVFLAVQGVGYARFRHLTRRWSEEAKNTRYFEILREESDALGVTAPKLTVCAAMPTPALTGLAHPALLLPHENYTETELRFILRHELYHLKRRDILYKLFLTLVNALHWFNPLVYLMLRAADEDIELSCDSAVTANMEKAERAAYSETLLKSVRERHGAVALTTCFGSTVERLKRRLANVFDDSKKSRGVAVVLLTVCAVVGLSAAIGFAPAKGAKPLAKTQGEYADVEDYLMHKMPAIGSEVSYYPYSADGTILEETAAKVLDRKLAWLNQTGTVANLAPEGVLQSWTYSYLLQLDAPTDDVLLVGGMYEENGYFDLEGQNGHDLIVLQYDDGSIDVLYDAPVNDNMGFYGYHLSYEEAIYDWYVIENDLDRTEYPLYVLDWRELLPDNYPAGNYPVHRCDGDGWYIYIPVNAWEPGVGEPIWYSSYGTESTIVVKTFDTPLSDAQAYFKREGWEGMNEDTIFVSYEGRFSNVYLYERPAGGHYEVQLFADFEKMAEIAETCPEVDRETSILIHMAQSFTVDERFSPALWIDPLYADALLNAAPISYVDETRSVPYFATDILTNLTRDDTHDLPDGSAAFAVVDLDGDGTAEVVYRRSDYLGYIVMHLYYGGVCGHELNYREMESLKRDGSMLGSGGADDTSFTRIRFDGTDMVLEREEYCVGTSSGGVHEVTREELDELIAKFESRPSVTWYEWTEENVRSVLGANRGTRTVAFDDIMGLSGFYSETTDGANFITRQYYVPAVVGGYTPIGGSFGYTIDDHVVDLDGDGVTELVCNCQYGADGAQRVFVYRLKNGAVEQGFYDSVYSTLPDYNNWGVNSSAEYYDANADEFVLGYSTTHGVAEMAEKRFTYRLLDFVPYAFNDTPYPAPLLPEKVSSTADTAAGTQSRVLRIDGRPVSLDLNGYFWFASTDGWICREKDGKTEQLYELPVNYMTDTFATPALRMQENYATLTYHIGGATTGSDVTIRFFDDGSYIEMPVNSSTSTQGDLWVSISNFVPPERGNLRISRDGGKNWSAFGSAEILYGWTYTAEGDYRSSMRNGAMYFTDDAVYLLGTHLDAPFDGTPSVTRVCRVDLTTGETEVLTGEAQKFSIVGQWIQYTSPDGTGHTCPLTGDLVPTAKYPQTGKWKS